MDWIQVLLVWPRTSQTHRLRLKNLIFRCNFPRSCTSQGVLQPHQWRSPMPSQNNGLDATMMFLKTISCSLCKYETIDDSRYACQISGVESMHCLDFNKQLHYIIQFQKCLGIRIQLLQTISNPQKRVPSDTFLKCVKALVSSHTFTSAKERSSFK